MSNLNPDGYPKTLCELNSSSEFLRKLRQNTGINKVIAQFQAGGNPDGDAKPPITFKEED